MPTRRLRAILVVAPILIAAICADAQSPEKPVSREEIKSLRETATHRTRRIIYDNDGNEPVYYLENADADELLAKRTKGVLGSQVDTIVYCTWSSGFGIFTHDTKVGEVLTCTAKTPDGEVGFSKNKTREFLEKGTDPLRIMVDFCRKNDIEVFWSMRMNDIHDAWGGWYSPYLFPKLKKDHPEWLMGTKEKRPKNGAWTAVDYGVPEIRDLAFRFVEEVCTNYDIDGIQLDFFRHLTYFRAHAEGRPVGQEELDMMTDLFRRIRTMTEEVGRKRGRPILISIRVPDSKELCKAVGFDLERLMAEDLIDLLVVSGYFRLNPWETSVALGHKYDVPVYPCLSETRQRDKTAARARASLEGYRGRAANVWRAGADGVYMFNFFQPNTPHWRELGSPNTLAPLEKLYTTGARGYGNLEFWYEGGGRFMNRDILNPSHPRALEPGKTVSVEMPVGDDPSAFPEAAVKVRIRFKDLANPGEVKITVNGQPVTTGGYKAPWLDSALKPSHIKPGPNRFEFTLSEDSQAKPVLEDLILRVIPGKAK